MSRSRSSKGLPWLLIGGIAIVAIVVVGAAVMLQPTPVHVTLEPIARQTVAEDDTLKVKAVAHVVGAPADTLRFRLVAAPLGAKINSKTGVFTWKPAELQGKKSHQVELRVQSTGPQKAEASTKFIIVVNEVNEPPVIFDIGEQTVVAGELLTFLVRATDPDIPAKPLEYRFGASAPQGARMDPQTGAFEWTPLPSAKEHDETVQVIVSEFGDKSGLKTEKTFKIHVTPAKPAAAP